MKYYYYVLKARVLIITIKFILLIYPFLRKVCTYNEINNLTDNLIKDLNSTKKD